MGLATTGYPHITRRDDGVAIIDGTTIKVIELIAEVHAYGWSPEELHFQHPGLSLGQIHSALAYYWDHREALDREQTQALREADAHRAGSPPSPFVTRLKTQGHP
ncbi:MAG: DUF433 domain-containing protein [Nitrospirae bacterium]|nr:DUF433 domain-containing protein [Nitrospirota bacterium]